MRSGDSEARRGQSGSGVWARADRVGRDMTPPSAGAGHLFVRPRLIVHPGPPSSATGHSAPASIAASARKSWSRVERVNMRWYAGVSCCARGVHARPYAAGAWTSGYGTRACGRESPRTGHAYVFLNSRPDGLAPAAARMTQRERLTPEAMLKDRYAPRLSATRPREVSPPALPEDAGQ
jgi:hypothetical protein